MSYSFRCDCKIDLTRLNSLVFAEATNKHISYDYYSQIRECINNVSSQLGNFVVSRLALREIKPLVPTDLGKIYDNIFNRTQTTSLKNKEDVKTFLTTCRQLFKNNSAPIGLRVKHNGSFLSAQQEEEYYAIDVERALKDVQDDFTTHGVMILRKINPEAKTLILGCGNGRHSDWICEPNHLGFQNGGISEEAIQFTRQYSIDHNHPKDEVVTIDPDPLANATIIGFFGTQPMAHLFKGQKFDQIIYEGYFPDTIHPAEKEEVATLLSENGKVFMQYLDDKDAQIVTVTEDRTDRFVT